MDKVRRDNLKTVLLEWHAFQFPESTPRDIDIPVLLKAPLTALIGPRRAGKTWLCFQAIRHLLEEKVSRECILYINLEDERLHPLTGDELTHLFDVHRELFRARDELAFYCFVDEIQNAPTWSKWARRITDQNPNLHLILTGSSAKLLGKEIATELRGRARVIPVFPYSWKEFLISQAWSFDGWENLRFSPRKPELRRLYEDFSTLGGFPGVRKTQFPAETLREYYHAMFALDIIERFRVKDARMFEDYLKLQISRFASLSSISNLEKELKSFGHRGSKATLLKYIGYAKETLLLFEVSLFSPKVRNQLLYPRKVYGIDQGLLNAIRFSTSEDRGRIFENMVFLELRRRGHEVFYFAGKGEADFVIRSGVKTTLIVQVCYRMDEAKTRARELQSLKEAMTALKCANGLVLTDDDWEDIGTGAEMIPVRPFWHWAVAGV
jgi:predicted AAA+ superfamily ATPase